jgi:signal transduction histidine kinase
MRLLVYELRPLVLQNEGLINALQQRLDAVERRAGIRAQLLVDGQVDKLEAVEQDLYWIVQEALNNSLKHAAASSVTVEIRVHEDGINISVVDDGRGFNVATANAKGGMGLVSIRERAENLGGTLTLHSAPGQGTHIELHVGNAR